MKYIIMFLVLTGFLYADSLSVFSVYGKGFSFPIVLVNYSGSVPVIAEADSVYRQNALQPLNCWPGTCLYMGAETDKLTAKLRDVNAYSLQPISSLLIPQGYALEADSIFREVFYSERSISPFVLNFTNERIHRTRKEQTKQSVPVEITQNKRSAIKITIFSYNRAVGSDFLFFRMEHTLYTQLSVTEILLFNEFVDWFFNMQLIPVGTKIHYKVPSFYALSSRYFPVYLPEVMLITDHNTVINILSNWSRIIRRIVVEIKADEMAKLRDELLDKLLTLRDSPLAEAVFVNKLALKSGRIIPPFQLIEQLREMDLDDTAKRFELLIEQEWLDLFWDTTKDVNDDLLKKLQGHFKLTVHRKNKSAEGLKQ